MKRFAMAVALAVALSSTVLAGNIPTGGAPTTSGDIQTPTVVTIILTIISVVTR